MKFKAVIALIPLLKLTFIWIVQSNGWDITVKNFIRFSRQEIC